MTGRDAMPHGFRQSVGSGLLVPELLSREREVWTDDEGRLLDRATKLLKSRGMQIFLRCNQDACHEAPITRVTHADGSYSLQCAHRDRVFAKAF